jgi:CRISPR-associated protein Cmr1
MNKITFHCQTVTPMFLAGADGTTLELRPASIKGVLRWWWRAMNADKEDMREEETKIFGGTGEPSLKSSFSIQISRFLGKDTIKRSLWDEIDHNNKRVDSDDQGKAYLLYSVFMVNERPYFEAGSSFSVTFQFSKKEYQSDVLKAWSALVWMGGLGTRSRRGAGSIKVNSIECADDALKATLSEEFIPQNIKNAKDLQTHIQRYFALNDHENLDFSTLKESDMLIFGKHSSWGNALESIGKPFSVFRNNNKSKIHETASFGFPINHRGGTTIIAGKGTGRDLVKLERRASPLLFKVVQSSENHFFPVIIWLCGDLIPNDHFIMKKDGYDKKDPSFYLVENFIDSLNPATQFKL